MPQSNRLMKGIRRAVVSATTIALLAGCGMWQSVKETAIDATRAVLKGDLLASMEATLGPGATIKLSTPMADDARAVGVVAFFREQSNAEWHVLIPKSQWKKTDPVTLVVTGNRMELVQ